MARRLTAILLLATFAATGSGLFQYLHLQEHAAVARAATANARGGVGETPIDPGHDESTCAVCLALHAPMIAGGYVPLLICLGLIAAFLSQISHPLVAQAMLARIDCRGPPSFC